MDRGQKYWGPGLIEIPSFEQFHHTISWFSNGRPHAKPEPRDDVERFSNPKFCLGEMLHASIHEIQQASMNETDWVNERVLPRCKLWNLSYRPHGYFLDDGISLVPVSLGGNTHEIGVSWRMSKRASSLRGFALVLFSFNVFNPSSVGSQGFLEEKRSGQESIL
jgi:hypothetical protein